MTQADSEVWQYEPYSSPLLDEFIRKDECPDDPLHKVRQFGEDGSYRCNTCDPNY